MCGITGFTWEDKDRLRKMTDVISYRGPDDHGYYTDSNISLGHRRLSIIDLSETGHQPMQNEDGSVQIVFNGEIYNYKELIPALEKKHSFRSTSDTEVLIHGYEEWGPDGLLKRLKGMFAFAIWDSNKKRLFIARDRIGIKPLYYAITNNNLVFASEMKSILELPDFKRQINPDSLNSYLTYRFITSDNTILKGIKKLLPGNYILFRKGKLEIKKYWDIEFKIEQKSEDYFVKKLKNILEGCVESHLMSEVPLGAFLSGGLDSSLVVAINSKLRKDPVKTFTVGFGHETDEFRHAKKVAEHLKTDHHELILEYDEMTKALPDIIRFMDEPNSDMTMVPLYFLSQFSRKKVTVVNTGEGADELFSGYQHFRVGSPSFNLVPDMIKRNVYSLYYSPFKSWDRKSLFTKLPKEDKSLDKYLVSSEPKDFLNRILLFDIKNELPNWQLTRVDRMSMAHAQEARVPFLDKDIVEFSASIPVNLKLKNLDGKYILKKVAKDYLPKDIIERKKQGFTTPRNEWIRKDLKDFAFDLLSKENVNSRKLFNYNYIEKLKNKVDSTDDKPFRPYSYRLMILAFFEMWCQMYLDKNKRFAS